MRRVTAAPSFGGLAFSRFVRQEVLEGTCLLILWLNLFGPGRYSDLLASLVNVLLSVDEVKVVLQLVVLLFHIFGGLG